MPAYYKLAEKMSLINTYVHRERDRKEKAFHIHVQPTVIDIHTESCDAKRYFLYMR